MAWNGSWGGNYFPPKIACELEMKILCSEGENDRFCKCLNSFNESDPQHVVRAGILKNPQQLIALQADSGVSMLRVTQLPECSRKKNGSSYLVAGASWTNAVPIWLDLMVGCTWWWIPCYPQKVDHGIKFEAGRCLNLDKKVLITKLGKTWGWEDSEDLAPLRIHNVWLVVKSPSSPSSPSSSSSSSSTVSQADKNNVGDVNQNQRCWTMDFLVLMIGVLGGKLQVNSWQNPSSSNFSSRIPSNHVP